MHVKSLANSKLTVLWTDADAPIASRRLVHDTYVHIYLPALTRDIERLHEVMMLSLRDPDIYDFKKYKNTLIGFRYFVGHSAIPSPDMANRRFEDLHKEYIEDGMDDIDKRARSVFRYMNESALCLNDKEVLAVCMACAAQDTSEALEHVAAAKLESNEGRAELYVASASGPAAVRDLLQAKWPAARREQDMRIIENNINAVLADHGIRKRIQTVRELNPHIARPKIDMFRLVHSA